MLPSSKRAKPCCFAALSGAAGAGDAHHQGVYGGNITVLRAKSFHQMVRILFRAWASARRTASRSPWAPP